MSQGADSFTAGRQALSMLYRRTLEQAQVLAYADDFWLISIVFLAILPHSAHAPGARRAERARARELGARRPRGGAAGAGGITEEANMATIEKYGAPGVYDPPGYSQGMKVTGARTLLFTAGQVPYDADGGVKHRGDFKAQARAVFGAVKALVEAGGGTLESVVKITTYVTDVRFRQDFRAVREEFFGARGPASTMVEVKALAHPDYLIEVEAIAVV